MSIFPRKKRTGAELSAEFERLLVEKASAQSKLDELLVARRDVELYGSVDALIAHDAEAAKQKLLIDRDDARLEQIERDRKALAAEADQTRRLGVYESAKGAHDKGREALRLYTKHAVAAADALHSYSEARKAIDEANAQLPEGKQAIADPEPNNEIPAYMPRQKPAFSHSYHELPKPAVPHQSVLEKAVLPALKRGEYYFGEANVAKVYAR
jgi:hypothetical protein